MQVEITRVEIFIILVILLSLTLLRYIYIKSRRISTLKDLPRDYSNLFLSGIVTSVADGDGFRFFHTPIFRSTSYKQTDPKLKVRLAGIDAPETDFFGFPAQPLSKESKDYLKSLVLYKKVELEVLSVDRYERILAVVRIRSLCSSVNINYEMLRSGLACVYKGSDEVFGSYYDEMVLIQEEAKKKKIGMWGLKDLILPMDFKKMRKRMK